MHGRGGGRGSGGILGGINHNIGGKTLGGSIASRSSRSLLGRCLSCMVPGLALFSVSAGVRSLIQGEERRRKNNEQERKKEREKSLRTSSVFWDLDLLLEFWLGGALDLLFDPDLCDWSVRLLLP